MARKSARYVLRSLMALLTLLMPTTIKRLVYMTSINFYLMREGVFKKASLHSFSQTLHVPTAVLVLPRSAMSLIWEPTDVINQIDNDPCNEYESPRFNSALRLAKVIVAATPAWLAYPTRKMELDTIKLFYLQTA